MENSIKGYNVVFISNVEAQYRNDYSKVFIGKVISEWFQGTQALLDANLAKWGADHKTPVAEMEVHVLS